MVIIFIVVFCKLFKVEGIKERSNYLWEFLVIELLNDVNYFMDDVV